ncbi:MAG: peptidoglycan DD-metalloendopeptidase family protein [Candidatus Peribacteraceae bacterium]|nr:peptidoglycan DD-metalloendopeptidase family protein [Candidatus Peribacteraceae bacterium]
MRPPLLRWLSLRVKLGCAAVFVLGSLLPPYVPKTALASDEGPIASQQFLFVEDGFLLKSSSLGVQGSRLAYGEGLIHRVQDGESLPSIARRYGITSETIRWANDLAEGKALQPGQELIVLPVDGVLHTVQRGQTLSEIAQAYDVKQEAVAEQNHVRDGKIVAGQQLIIPGGKPGAGGTMVASNDGTSLTFGQRLGDAQLRLQLPQDPARQRGLAPAVGAAITQTALQMPCQNCIITQYFNAAHYALDIQTKGGGPIFAAEDGTVIRADKGWNGGYGNVIEVEHANGMITLYAHNKELYVKEGDSVTRGQQMAWMGNTGLVHGPTGIHIHFEVRVNGVKKNPLLYLE